MRELFLYNTQTKQKERFQPRKPGQVQMYVCGMTVYDFCHLGHARAYTAFDVIQRFFKHLGYQVTYVRNITDIDDKIIKRAQHEIPDYESNPTEACEKLTHKYIGAFHEDMEALGLESPTLEPRATEHLPDMISLIQNLVDKGHAYEADGNVYFQVTSFKEYGKLSKRDIEQMETVSRIEVDPFKRSPMDFALWKKHLPGEPAFESPFGPGRPGWHIECSAMSMRYLGKTFDIHGGGKDLVFPHHENELCQSEAATGKTFVHYWLHNGFITTDQEKMSKSLGNFKTLRDCLAEYPPTLLKYYLLSTHYRSPLEFHPQLLQDSLEGFRRLENTISEARAFLEAKAPHIKDQSLENDLPEAFLEAMCDDFNTPKALGVLHNVCTLLNTELQNAKMKPETIHETLQTVEGMLGLLGIAFTVRPVYEVRDSDWKEANKDTQQLLDQNPDTLEINTVYQLVKWRGFAKSEKHFALADQIRDYLKNHQVELRDEPKRVTFRFTHESTPYPGNQL